MWINIRYTIGKYPGYMGKYPGYMGKYPGCNDLSCPRHICHGMLITSYPDATKDEISRTCTCDLVKNGASVTPNEVSVVMALPDKSNDFNESIRGLWDTMVLEGSVIQEYNA